MVVYLSLLVAVVGVLMYALSSNPKLQEIGRLSYGCGLLSFLLTGAEKLISLLPK
jgi:SpoU rRNA methylase family enzyme